MAALGLLALALPLSGDSRLRSMEGLRDRVLPPAFVESLRDGDLVLRRGSGALSRLVLETDTATEFSHVGMAWRSDEGVRVIHAAPGELPEVPDVVRADPIERYLAHDLASSYAVLRLRDWDASKVRIAVGKAMDFARREVPFDAALALDDPSRIYCTELIWRAYLEAGIDLAPEGGTELRFLGIRGSYLAVSQLTSSPLLETLGNAEASAFSAGLRIPPRFPEGKELQSAQVLD